MTDAGDNDPVLCSDCFRDEGLRLDAFKLGIEQDSACPNCGSTAGRKLSRDRTAHLAYRFFVRGTTLRTHFGGAPMIQFNDRRPTSVRFPHWLEPDVPLFEKTIGVGFFHYGPRLWMVGEVEPLKALERPDERSHVIGRILTEYPARELTEGDVVYRVRRDPRDPLSPTEYDSPPEKHLGNGRLDSPGFPVLYASGDVQVCVHECRLTVEDEAYIASLSPTQRVRLLDLTEVLQEKATEFESLDMAVHMLFLAGAHSYEISRAISIAVHQAGYDGLIYPSYYSLIRTGARPFDTAYGISVRRFPGYAAHAKAQTIPNVAIFGKPVAQGTLRVRSINRVVLNKVEYDLVFGPVGY